VGRDERLASPEAGWGGSGEHLGREWGDMPNSKNTQDGPHCDRRPVCRNFNCRSWCHKLFATGVLCVLEREGSAAWCAPAIRMVPGAGGTIGAIGRSGRNCLSSLLGSSGATSTAGEGRASDKGLRRTVIGRECRLISEATRCWNPG
jgi:hypothetical protein